MLHNWYCKLLPIITNKVLPKNSKPLFILGKVAIDQALFPPIMLCGFWIFHATVSKGDPWHGI